MVNDRQGCGTTMTKKKGFKENKSGTYSVFPAVEKEGGDEW